MNNITNSAIIIMNANKARQNIMGGEKNRRSEGAPSKSIAGSF